MKKISVSLLFIFILAACSKEKEPEQFTIAFGSCSKQYEQQPLWQEMLQHNPDLFIWLGDNVYADTYDMQQMARIYQEQLENPDYQAFTALVPVIGIWDDHDYGMNDAGKYYPKKDSSKMLMMDFLEVPENSPRRKRAGAYESYTYNFTGKTIKIILLDTRYFRDSLQKSEVRGRRYEPSETGTMLGEQQWQWLSGELQNPGDINIIGSSIQVISQEHGWEKWHNFPHERERLLSLIAESDAPNVFFITGDRHIAEISRMRWPEIDYPLYDITSSGLTHTWAHAEDEPNQHRVDSLVARLNYGLIKISKQEENLSIQVDIRGEEDALYLQQTLF
ncbi:MAG: alkaline phosphatase D family protein [Cyclobacteriaceae bacterium]